MNWISRSLFALAFFVALSFQWTFIPVSTSHLVLSADTVIEGSINGDPIPSNENGIWTNYKVTVSRWLKKPHDINEVQEIVISVPGGFDESTNMTLHIYGSPNLIHDEKVIMFLKTVYLDNGSTRYELNHFSQGMFVVLEDNENKIAIRPYEMQTETTTVQVRSLDSFISFIESVNATGLPLLETSSAFISIPTSNVDSMMSGLYHGNQRFNLFSDGTYNIRWKVFDTAGSVNWLRDTKGQPGLAGGGLTELQQAFNAWNNNTNTPVSYRLTGPSTSITGLSRSDGKNSIIYEDPGNYIAGAFSCSTGGTLAVGGFFYSSQLHSFRGINWRTIVEVDVVVQNGISCYFQNSANPSATYSNIITHELGHTLGIQHSCGDSATGTCTVGSPAELAIMRAYARPNGGPNLGIDDHKAIEFLYSTCYPNCP